MGHMVSFEGGAVLHGGLPITGGTRYILAVFLYISQMKEVGMIDGDIPKGTTGIDHEDDDGDTGHGNTGHYNDAVRNCCDREGVDTNSGYHSLKRQKLSNHTTTNVHSSVAENKVTSYSFGFSFDTLK